MHRPCLVLLVGRQCFEGKIEHSKNPKQSRRRHDMVTPTEKAVAPALLRLSTASLFDGCLKGVDMFLKPGKTRTA